MSKSERPIGAQIEGGMDGQTPVTDRSSRNVMLASERHDNIEITERVTVIEEDTIIPNEVSVIKRTDTYHGPKLLVHNEIDSEDYNFLLTAPGPDTHLCLWAGEIDEESGKRKGWKPVAEVKARLAAEQPPYEKCDQCGELIRTIYHERESVVGNCSRA